MSELRRATSVEEYLGKMPNLVSEAGKAYAASFSPRPDDVLVATYAKAGTTWMQQIVHGLRTGGDMDFGEITDVVPWIELAHDCGWDINAEQKAAPRAYKTHHPYESVPKGAKYIWVVRDPKDSALSFFNFMNGWFLEVGAISADDFVQEFFMEDYLFGGYWGHLLGWWAVKDDPSVLALSFEDVKQDLAGTVKKVAQFIGHDLDKRGVDVATQQADFSFMKAREPQFDDHPIAVNRNAAVGLPTDARSSKIKTGNVGDYKQLSDETIKLLDEKWAATVGKNLGFEGYAQLRAAL